MELLNKYGQDHIVEAINNLEGKNRELLRKQVNTFDLEKLMTIYHKKDQNKIIDTKITPMDGFKLSENEIKKYHSIGINSIINNEVAVVLMAGGQGTRLGHEGPKGTFDIGLSSEKSLFEIHCDELHRLKELTDKNIYWYIMTSEDNHKETVEFFEAKEYFNYAKEFIKFFKQDRLPLLLENGQLAMSDDKNLNLAANGNGGVFTSLKTNMILDEMKNSGVKYVFLYGVDNALAKLADPTFIGFMKEKNFDIASKAVDKIDASEKVGVMCYKNSKPAIVEYSELDDSMRHARNDQGTLTYRHANILAHMFKLDFIQKCSELELPYHVAHKKVNYFNGQEIITSDSPNGYKFELFMFDVFEYADDMAVLTVNRNEEFAPVKNKVGNDSPKTARELYKKVFSNKEVT